MNVLKTHIKRILKWPTNRRVDYIFEDLGLIFVHIPKTGGTSIRKILETAGPSKDTYAALNKHATARQIRAAVGRRKWNQCRSLAVVRNPWSWTVSSYHWWLQIAPRNELLVNSAESIKNLGSFRNYVRSVQFRDYLAGHRGRDFIDWISDGREIIVTDILRMESLNNDWTRFMSENALEFPPLQRLNKSEHDDYRSYFDEETISIVARKFAHTIERFGYQFQKSSK